VIYAKRVTTVNMAQFHLSSVPPEIIVHWALKNLRTAQSLTIILTKEAKITQLASHARVVTIALSSE
jgi:hypothetical protein